MSLRATGEGHVSSIVFRSGVLDSDNRVLFDPTSDYVETPEVHLNSVYDRHLFDLKLLEMGASNEVTAHLLGQLPEDFTYNELKNKIESLRTTPVFPITRQTSYPVTEFPNGLSFPFRKTKAEVLKTPAS
jgi:hypothetical protein